MIRLHLPLLFICAFFITSCSVAPEPTLVTPTSAIPSQTFAPSDNSTSVPTITTEKTPLNPTLSSDVTLPSLYYILDKKIFELAGDKPEIEIASISDPGTILGAFRAEIGRAHV